MKHFNIAKKVSLYGMLIALAMLLSYVESLLPIFPIPGMKLGLANLVIIIALYVLSVKSAIIISIVRIILISITFGNMSAFMFSLGGAVLSLVMMILVLESFKFSIIGVSMFGAVFHNVGQILVAVSVLENILIFSYLPYLIIVALVTGILIGLISKLIIQRIKNGVRF